MKRTCTILIKIHGKLVRISSAILNSVLFILKANYRFKQSILMQKQTGAPTITEAQLKAIVDQFVSAAEQQADWEDYKKSKVYTTFGI